MTIISQEKIDSKSFVGNSSMDGYIVDNDDTKDKQVSTKIESMLEALN